MCECVGEYCEATGRIVNSGESQTWYPWVVYITRYNAIPPPKRDNDGKRWYSVGRKTCGGGIITRRYIIKNN